MATEKVNEVRRSATQTLIDALEDFGTSEPKEALLIYTQENGDLVWSCTTDSVTVKLGLLEACKQFMIAKIVRQESE